MIDAAGVPASRALRSPATIDAPPSADAAPPRRANRPAAAKARGRD